MPAASPLSLDQTQRRRLRRELRTRRRSLSRQQQRHAALTLARQLLKHPQVQRSRHLALYLPNDGEIDPGAFIQVARRLGKVCYLPVLHPIYKNRLWFVRYDDTTALRPNRFGIPEPQPYKSARRSPRALDLVLLPLVGFDSAGGRLGMGGGFYDRTFAFKLRQNQDSPYLIGLAHECQHVPALPVAPWDVPLNAVVSDRAIYSFPGSSEDDSEKPDATTSRFFGRYRLSQSRKGQRRRLAY